MDLKTYPSVPPKTLDADLTASGTKLKITDKKSWDQVTDLAASNFPADYIPVTLINPAFTKLELLLIDATTFDDLFTATGATIYKRGLPYFATGNFATDTTEVPANKFFWAQGETIVLIGTNQPWLYGTFANKYNTENIQEVWTFLATKIAQYSAAPSFTPGSNEIPTVNYVDTVAGAAGGISAFSVADGGGLTANVTGGQLVARNSVITVSSSGESMTDNTTNYIEVDPLGNIQVNTTGFTDGLVPIAEVITSGGAITSIVDKRAWLTADESDKILSRQTYGDTISANELLYLDTADGKWKLADASAVATCSGELAIALEAGVDTDTNQLIQTGGVVTGLSGLTAGWVYASDTAGALSATPGTVERRVGWAINATTLILVPDAGSATPVAEFNVRTDSNGQIKKFERGIEKTETAGATITGSSTPVPVYQDSSDGEWYNAEADNLTKLGFAAFAITDGTDGNDFQLQYDGVVSGFSGLTQGELYYLQDDGSIGTETGTYVVPVGRAISATELVIQTNPKTIDERAINAEGTLVYYDMYNSQVQGSGASEAFDTSNPLEINRLGWVVTTGQIAGTAKQGVLTGSANSGSADDALKITFSDSLNNLDFDWEGYNKLDTGYFFWVPSGDSANAFIGFGDYDIAGDNGTTDFDITDKHVGFLFRGDNAATSLAYASVADGTTQTKVDISGAVGNFAVNTYKQLTIELFDGEAKFYVDGTLATTITTNLPTGTGELANLSSDNGGGTGNTYSFGITNTKVIHELS